jgi:hypothetical protein
MYHLLLFISYLGLVIGVIIANRAQEELKTGNKYFLIAQQIIFGILFFIFMYELGLHIVISAALTGLAVIFAILWRRTMKHMNVDPYFYGLFPIIIFETETGSFAPIATLLIFIFGLLTAGMHYEKELNLFFNIKNILTQYIIYPIVGIVLTIFII